jgi:hypothetical protein
MDAFSALLSNGIFEELLWKSHLEPNEQLETVRESALLPSSSAHRFWTDQHAIDKPAGVFSNPITRKDKVARCKVLWSRTDTQTSSKESLLSVERVRSLVNHLNDRFEIKK